MGERGVAKTVIIGGKPITGRILDGTIEIAFSLLALLVGMLFFLQYQHWVIVPPSIGLLLLALWCPCFWGKYWRLGYEGQWYRRTMLLLAGLETGLTILAAIMLAVGTDR